VRRDPEELRLELVAGADIDRGDFVFEAQFFERDVHLVAVRRRPGPDFKHRGFSFRMFCLTMSLRAQRSNLVPHSGGKLVICLDQLLARNHIRPMSSQFNIAEAKAKLSELLDRALAGEDIVIARAGTPLAKLTPLKR